MKKTKKQLEEELESTRTLIQTYRRETDCLKSQITNLETVKTNMENDVRDRDNRIGKMYDSKHTIVKILAGPSKPLSKVEAIEDLMALDVHFMRKEFEERKQHGPQRMCYPNQFI